MTGFLPLLHELSDQFSGPFVPTNFSNHTCLSSSKSVLVMLWPGCGSDNLIFNCGNRRLPSVELTMSFTGITVSEGTYLTNKFTVDENGTDNVLYSKNDNIDTTTIRVEVQENPNQLILSSIPMPNLVTITPESRVFWLGS